MRFLAKDPGAVSLVDGLTYTIKGDNRPLRKQLVDEQEGYCAYTEKALTPLDSAAVEHFDRRLKTEDDDARNYYATLQSWNQRKRRTDAQFEGASFFDTRFFQDAGTLRQRIGYLGDEHLFEEVDPDDTEAADLIAYLGANDPDLVGLRRRHAQRLRAIFVEDARVPNALPAYLDANPEERSFPTALHAAFGHDVVPLTTPPLSLLPVAP